MKFALAISLLLSLTAVSSQFAGTWLLDWQTENVPCAAVTFTITQNGPGYSVSYGYSSTTFFIPECSTTIGITQNFTSALTLNTTSNAYIDIKNQSLTYYPGNNTILFLLPVAQDNLILFTTNGAYIPQEEVAGLIAGVWTGAQFNQSQCQNDPPINISISITQQAGFSSPTATYYYLQGSVVARSTYTLNLYDPVPQINQPVWSTGYYYGNSNITYNLNQATNQSTLVFQLSQSLQFGACIATYTRALNLVSGTWVPDWQDGDIQSTYVPTSIQVTNIYNMYMRIAFNFVNGSSNRGILYPSANGLYTDSFYQDTYYPSSNSFILTVNFQTYLFSTNGSIFNLQPFLGKWSNTQFDGSYSNTDLSDYCCYPQSIGIYNLTEESELSSLFTYDGYVANTSGCQQLRGDMSQNVFLQMTLSIPKPNGTQLTYQNTEYGYTLYLNSLDASQLQVVYKDGGNYCNFTMTGHAAPPNPLSAQLIAKGISFFIFALIVIFM